MAGQWEALGRKISIDAHKRKRFRPLALLAFVLDWIAPLAYVLYVSYDPTEKTSWLKIGGMAFLIVLCLVYFFYGKKKFHDAFLLEKAAEKLNFAKMHSIKLGIFTLIDTVAKIAAIYIAYLLVSFVYSMSQMTMTLLNVILWLEVIGHIIKYVDFLENIGYEQLEEEAHL